MMSSLFCLVLFLSFLHACNARSSKETHEKQFLFSVKDVISSTVVKIKAQENFWAKMDESIIHESPSVANAMPGPRHSKALGMKEKNEKGIKVIKTSLQQAFQETESEKWKGEARSTLQSMQPNAEETVDPKENGLPEDVVVMDYAQPHRKPPIHNIEP